MLEQIRHTHFLCPVCKMQNVKPQVKYQQHTGDISFIVRILENDLTSRREDEDK